MLMVTLPGARTHRDARPAARCRLGAGLLGGPPRRSPGLVPPERERDRDGDEEAAGAGEPGGDIEPLVDDRGGAGQVAEGILELVSLLSAVGLAAGVAVG